MSESRTIFVIGAPASGKGTLCRQWCSANLWHHLSIGDHLRTLLRENDPSLSDAARDKLAHNELLSTVEIISILQKELTIHPGKTVMLDGFPRRLEQANAFEEAVTEPILVLFFSCPKEIALQRYLERALPGRDADLTVFNKRYDEFHNLNGHIVEEYRSKGILREIDTSNETTVSYANLVRVMADFISR